MPRSRKKPLPAEPEVLPALLDKNVPASPEEMRLKSSARAGFTGEIIEKAVKVLSSAMDSEDGNLALRAAENVLEIAGAYPSRTASLGGGGKVQVEILVAPWAKPQ